MYQEDDVPTYAYACTACDHRFEVQQSFTDASLSECPQCEGRLRKLFNAVGIVFKGSGFYRTDSRGANGSAATAGSNGTPKTGSDGGSSSGSSSTGTSSTASGSGSNGSGSSGSGSNGSGSTSSASSPSKATSSATSAA
jgi:putative FmdB family regulatory protein